MSILEQKDLRSIAKNEFEIEFNNGSLIQKIADKPHSYLGSGRITQCGDGKLHLRMNCQLDSPDAFARELNWLNNFNRVLPGQLIDDREYFVFEAVDHCGRKWTSENIRPTAEVGGETLAVIVEAELTRIESCEAPSIDLVNIPSKIFYVPGTYRFPFNCFHPEATEAGFSAATIDLGGGCSCDLKNENGMLVVSVEYQAVESVKYPHVVLEALGICIGAHLVPQIEIGKTSTEHVQIIRRLDRDSSQLYRLSPPLPMDTPGAHPGVQAFIQHYLRFTSEPYSQLAGYWFRVLLAFHGSLENQALVLTTAIEGVLKVYFLDLCSPDEGFVQEIDEARPIVNELLIGQRALGRIKSSLDSAKTPTPANALLSLKIRKGIPPDLPKVWRTLRNKSAHAAELGMEPHNIQEFINALYACLELFYRLIMLKIGFDGTLIRYSQVGWPQRQVANFSTG